MAQSMPPAESGAGAVDEAADGASEAGDAEWALQAEERAREEEELDEVEDEDDDDVDEAFLGEVVLVASAAMVYDAVSCPCSKDPLCVRGFKHGGKGGKCSYKAK